MFCARLSALLVAGSICVAEGGYVVDNRGSAEGNLQPEGDKRATRSLVRKLADDHHHSFQRWEQPVDFGDESDFMRVPSMGQRHNEIAQETADEFRQEVKGTTPSAYIELGTPKKKLFVIMDTGSDKLVAKTWSTIQRELRSVDGGIDDAVMPSDIVYNRGTSSSYTAMYMNNSDPQDMMMQKQIGGEPGKDGEKVQKRGFIAYGSGIAITEEGSDNVFLGGNQVDKFPLSEIVQDQLSMLHTKQGIAGILGLQHMKNGSLGESIFTRSRAQGRMYSFGYCRGDNNDGTFIWGDKSTEGHKLDVIGQIHWAVPLGDVKMDIATSEATAKADDQQPQKQEKQEKQEQQPETQDQRMEEPHGSMRVLEHGQHGQRHRSSGDGLEQRFADWMGQHEGGQHEGAAQGFPFDMQPPNLMQTESVKQPDNSKISDDKELKDEIGKIVGDIISKVVDRVEHGKTGHHDSGEASDSGSQSFCGGEHKCTAIIDTGSNIIAGPSAAVKALSKFAQVKYDCSNFDKLPTLNLALGDFKVSLPPKAYVMQINLPKGMAQGKGKGGGEGEGEGEGEGQGEGQGEGGEGGGSFPGDSDSDSSGQGGGGMGNSSSDGQGPLGFVRKSHRRQQEWRQAFVQLSKQFGVDFSTALQGMNFKGLMHTDKLCMPAFVPLDKDTKIGKLWVVGTPLFEQYYARWSWQKGEDSPSIFFEDKHKVKACEGTSVAKGHGDSLLSSSPQSVQAAAGSGLLRRERKGDAMLLEEVVGRPKLEMDIFDIKYPHWAKDLSNI